MLRKSRKPSRPDYFAGVKDCAERRMKIVEVIEEMTVDKESY